MRRSLELVLATVATLTLGCSTSTTPGGNAAVEDVPALYADAFCDNVDTCGGPLIEAFLGGNDCVDIFGPAITDGQLPLWQAGIEAGTIAYDGSMVSACLREIDRLGCAAFNARDIEACVAVFTGTVAAGGVCNSNEECTGSLYCDSGSACPGTCATRRAAGAACGDDETCTSGLTCEDGECTQPAALGAACGGDSAPDCALPGFCVGEDDDAGTPGTCRNIDDVFTASIGEPCDVENGVFCTGDASCALVEADFMTGATTWTCVAPSASGGSCNAGFPDPCPSGQGCDADIFSGSLDGTCQALPNAGMPCADSFIGAACADGLSCVDETCASIARLGAACEVGEGCASGFCEAGVCSVPACG